MTGRSGGSDSARGCDRCCAPPADGKPPIEVVRPLWQSSHSSFELCRCTACGQPFLRQFHEVLDWGDGDDDVWTRWMPLMPDEVGELEAACPEADLPRPRVDWNWLAAFVRRRGRLVRDPKGRLGWSEQPIDGCDLAPPG